MGITRANTGEKDLTDVGLVVSVGVLEEEGVRPVGADHPTIGENHGGWNGELVGKDGELVGPAVVVGVFADLDAIVTDVASLEVVGIVNGFHHEGPPPFIPGNIDRIDDVGIGGEEG